MGGSRTAGLQWWAIGTTLLYLHSQQGTTGQEDAPTQASPPTSQYRVDRDLASSPTHVIGLDNCIGVAWTYTWQKGGQIRPTPTCWVKYRGWTTLQTVSAKKQRGRYVGTFCCRITDTFLRGFTHWLWGRHCIHVQRKVPGKPLIIGILAWVLLTSTLFPGGGKRVHLKCYFKERKVDTIRRQFAELSNSWTEEAVLLIEWHFRHNGLHFR